MTRYGAGVECESENVLFLFSLGCVSFKGPSMNPGSVPPSQVWSRLQYVPVRERGGGRDCVSACVASAKGRWVGRRNGDDGPNEWLVSCRRDAKGEMWPCGFALSCLLLAV